MKKRITILSILIILVATGFSQQVPVNNQYLINKYSLNPSYAGYNENTEGFLGYRNTWVGVEGAPQFAFLSLNGPVMDNKMGLGFDASHEQIGNFKNVRIDGTYAYHLIMSDNLSVNFGLSGELYRTQLDLENVQSQGFDPYFMNQSNLAGTTFDATFGMMVNFSNLNIGIVVPQMLGNKVTLDGSPYTLVRHYDLHLSYTYQKETDLRLEPFVLIRMADGGSLYYEGHIFVDLKEKLWFGLGYRKGSSFLLSTGAALTDRIALNYTYEYGIGSGIAAASSGTHEISIGFLIQCTKNKNHPPSIFKFLEDITIPKIDPKLEGRVAKLEKDLKACCEQKTQPANTDELKKLDDRVRKLEGKVTEADLDKYDAPFILKNINFATNSDKLLSSSNPELNKIVEKMKKGTDLEIKIIGYTDNAGSIRYNQRLSEKRAIAIKEYFVTQGIDEKRIVTEGKGQDNPIADNETAEGRSQNRRIEAMFKKKK